MHTKLQHRKENIGCLHYFLLWRIGKICEKKILFSQFTDFFELWYYKWQSFGGHRPTTPRVRADMPQWNRVILKSLLPIVGCYCQLMIPIPEPMLWQISDTSGNNHCSHIVCHLFFSHPCVIIFFGYIWRYIYIYFF